MWLDLPRAGRMWDMEVLAGEKRGQLLKSHKNKYLVIFFSDFSCPAGLVKAKHSALGS